jgi:hypothetical protein
VKNAEYPEHKGDPGTVRRVDGRLICVPNRIAHEEEKDGFTPTGDHAFDSAMATLLQKGKEEDQGLIVLATRKPRVSNRTLVWRLTRTAARTERADSLRQEPPRTTRKLGSPPRNHADPFVGAPS